MKKTTAGLVMILLLATVTVRAQIIVRQEKDGTLNISNDYASSYGDYKKLFNKSRRSSATRSRSHVIPALYLEKIRLFCAQYGVQEALVVAVARAESSFNTLAVSPKGAVGIMQLMQETANLYGVVNRYNAHQNLEAGIRHLKYLYDKYDGDIPLTLAAYNAGEEAVKKYKGVPPYNETRNYIKRIMQYMGMSYSGAYSAKTSTKIYQYRTTDGKIMITDSYPVNAVKSSVTIID